MKYPLLTSIEVLIGSVKRHKPTTEEQQAIKTLEAWIAGARGNAPTEIKDSIKAATQYAKSLGRKPQRKKTK